MSSIDRVSKPTGAVYVARWRDPEGRQRKKSYPKKGDATRFLATVDADALRGSYVDPHDRTTLIAYAREWAAARPHRPTTARRVSSLIETHIAATRIGNRRIAAVLPSEVQAWASDRAQVLAPSTLRNLVSLLRSIYRSAVLDRLVATSPVVRVSLPRYERERVVPLTIAQVQHLADAMPARNRAMVITQAGLGLRIGELLGLRVEDVNFLRKTARVDQQIAPGAKIRSEPKTPRSRRTIPLPQVVADALAAHIAQFPALDDGTLFTTNFGQPYSHAYYGTVIFKKAIETANERARKATRDDLLIPLETSTHDLRHHYASVLLAAGESVVAVAERLGHDDASLVLSTYGHLMPDSEERTIRAVDRAWRALSVPSATRATR